MAETHATHFCRGGAMWCLRGASWRGYAVDNRIRAILGFAIESESARMKYFIYCRKSSEAEDRQVLSIESQLTTLRHTFVERPEIEIVAVYEEAFSAKAPGRRLFNEMLLRIEK